MTPDPFDALAHKAQLEREREAAAKNAERLADQNYAKKWIHRFGFFSTSPFFSLIWPSVFIVPLLCLPFWVWLRSPLLIVIGVSVTPLLMLITLLQASFRHPREQRWLASLPVPVEGHLQMLGFFDDSHGQSGTWSALDGVLELNAPAGDELAEVFSGFDQRLTLKLRDEGKRLEFSCASLLSDDGLNQPYYRWIRRFSTELLAPLHAKFGVRSLRLSARNLGRKSGRLRGPFEDPS